MKTCRTCLVEKPISEFYKKSAARSHIGDGHDNTCKTCAISRAHSPANKARAKELRKLRPLTPRTLEGKREHSMRYSKTEKGKQVGKDAKARYLSNPLNHDKTLQTQKLYRQTKAFSEAVAKSRAKYPEKRQAQILFSRAIREGKITRTGLCSSCGITCKPEGHHYDYSKPLDVIWVCRKCHLAYHSRL